MRSLPVFVFVLSLLTAGPLGGCVQSSTCGDVGGPNARVTDVAYDDQDETLYVAVSHSVSFCTASGDKPFIHELITVDLATGSASFEHEASGDLHGYDVPDYRGVGYYHGNFSNYGIGGCSSCELLLKSDDAASSTFRFTTGVDEPWAMILDITRGGEPVLTIDIGGSSSEVHDPERQGPGHVPESAPLPS